LIRVYDPAGNVI